jgi:CTP:molybdopterin cytidylyltransferase MocA
MGAFKPLLPFGNKTVIDAASTTCAKAASEEIVVVLGHRAMTSHK